MDYMDALLTPASDDEQLAALSDSLRGRKRAADFFALSTIGNISDAAKSEQKAVLKSAERQGQLRRAMSEQKQKEEQARLKREHDSAENRLDRESLLARSAMGGRGGGTSKYGQWVVDPETGEDVYVYFRDGNFYEPGSDQPFDMGSAERVRGKMSEAGEAMRLESLGKRMDDLGQLVTSIDRLDSLIARYVDEGKTPDETPGLGYWEKQQQGVGGSIGGAARLVQDAMTEGSPHADIFSAWKSVINQIGVSRAGLAQTQSEIERIYTEVGADAFSDPAVFMTVYPGLKEAIEGDLQDIRSTTSKRVIDTYDKGTEGGRNLTKHKFKRHQWSGEQESEPVDYENMTEAEIDAELARRKAM